MIELVEFELGIQMLMLHLRSEDIHFGTFQIYKKAGIKSHISCLVLEDMTWRREDVYLDENHHRSSLFFDFGYSLRVKELEEENYSQVMMVQHIGTILDPVFKLFHVSDYNIIFIGHAYTVGDDGTITYNGFI